MSDSTARSMAMTIFVIFFLLVFQLLWWGFWTVVFADPAWPLHLWTNPDTWSIALRFLNAVVEIVVLLTLIDFTKTAAQIPEKGKPHEAP